MLANPVARDQILAGKALGHLGVLSLILAVAFVVAALFVQLAAVVQLSANELLWVVVLFVVSLLYVTAMYNAGLLLSASTRSSASSLVLAVFGWLLAVSVYPNTVAFAVDTLSPTRAAVRAAGDTEAQVKESFGTWLRQRALEVTQSEWGPSLGGSSSSNNWSEPRGYFVGGFLDGPVPVGRWWLPWPRAATNTVTDDG